jgi:ribosome biogenesis GTPase
LTGQSGVGKSSLLNRINPELAITTQEISHALNRGKHTTRYTQLHQIYGGYLADTPGFSSLDFSKMKPIDLAYSVLEFRPYLSKCKFNDCIHEFEPNCAIKKAVEEGKVSKIRYQNYLDILKVVKENKR